jgi:hypothetical protein
MAKSFSLLSIPDLLIIREGLELSMAKHMELRKNAEKNSGLKLSKEFMDSYQSKIDRTHELKVAIETEIFNLQTGD